MHSLARCIRTLAGGAVALAAVASQPAQATLIVVATVLPLDPTSFRWEISIENQGPDDVAIVSLVDAPLADPLIDPSLVAPTGFLASYDDGLGFVDFLEDVDLFAAGVTTAGFAFVTGAAPDSGMLASFEALTVLGDFESGDVVIQVVPEPHTALLVGLGLGGLFLNGRKKEGSR